jgi:hypothetical protein
MAIHRAIRFPFFRRALSAEIPVFAYICRYNWADVSQCWDGQVSAQYNFRARFQISQTSVPGNKAALPLGKILVFYE